MLSSLVPIVKGKGDPLNPNSYRGIKLFEHAVKLYEKSLDGRLHEVVDIDKRQYGFMPGTASVDAVFILGRLTEKFRAKNKLFFIFANLEKVSQWVPQECYSFCFKVDGCARIFGKWGVKSLYIGYKTAASIDGELTSSFSMKVGVHQGSALRPLLLSW